MDFYHVFDFKMAEESTILVEKSAFRMYHYTKKCLLCSNSEPLRQLYDSIANALHNLHKHLTTKTVLKSMKLP